MYVAIIISTTFCKLTRSHQASGVPLLEEKSDKKFKDDEDWKNYKRNVPIFWPWSSGDRV
jgi:steroid 5-alpha reductase family enzyme